MNNKFIDEIWAKKIQQQLEHTNEFMEKLNREELQKEIIKQDERIKEIMKALDGMETVKIAEVIYAHEKEIERQEEHIKNLISYKEILDEIADKIKDCYGYDEY